MKKKRDLFVALLTLGMLPSPRAHPPQYSIKIAARGVTLRTVLPASCPRRPVPLVWCCLAACRFVSIAVRHRDLAFVRRVVLREEAKGTRHHATGTCRERRDGMCCTETYHTRKIII